MTSLDRRLAELPTHQRVLAEAQMARAEAIADGVASLVAWLRRLAAPISGRLGARARTITENRTRRWPHDAPRDKTGEFPSIGLQH